MQMPRLSRVAVVGVGVAGAAAFISMFEGAQTSKATSTPGTAAIDNRHSAAGGSGDHTPAAATKLGSEENREGGMQKDKGEFASRLGVW